jgi:cbb3-type cytochrome oxidase subunit 3
MKLSDIMSHAGLAGYAEVALVIFIVAFLVLLIRIFAPGRRQEMDRARQMPLDDEHPVEPRKEEKKEEKGEEGNEP